MVHLLEQINQWFAAGATGETEIILRLLLAAAAGAIVGIEREYRGRAAGLRTHILVALGAAILSIASIELANLVNGSPKDLAVRVDVSRIAAGMITGVGFLGAGTIIKHGRSVMGLTTAASIWCITSIGMAFGFGFFRLGFLGALLMMFTLVVVNRLEKNIAKDWYKNITVELQGGAARVEELAQFLKDRNWVVHDVNWQRDKTREVYQAEYELRISCNKDIGDLARLLDQTDFVRTYRIE